MAQDNYRKIKLLKLLELLRMDTDEQHPLSTQQLCARLGEMGIICDRRTLSRDIALLNEQGYEVMDTAMGHEKGYYVEDRSFSVPELKILMDAVQASSFITRRKTDELIRKIADLGGTHRAEILQSNMVSFNTRKHSNEHIFYNVDALEQAIAQQKKVIFLYYDLNYRAEKVYRREGHHYVVEPIALVFHEDNYYMICYSSRHGSTSTYRLDRMESVELLEEGICQEAMDLKEQIAGYTEQVFKMYGGQQEDVVLEFHGGLIGVVFDQFGENTTMLRAGEDRYVASVKVRVSPVFWGWLFQFAGEMRIISPANLVTEYSRRADLVREKE